MAIPHLQDSSLRLTDCIFFGDSIAEAAFSGIILDGSVTLAKLAPEVTAVAIGGAAASHNHAAGNITSGTLPVARGGTGVASLVEGLGLFGGASGNSIAQRKGFQVGLENGTPYVGVQILQNENAFGYPTIKAPLNICGMAGSSDTRKLVAKIGAEFPPGPERAASVVMSLGPSVDDGSGLTGFGAEISYNYIAQAGANYPKQWQGTYLLFTLGSGGLYNTEVFRLDTNGQSNALHGMNVYDGQLVVEAKKGLIDTGDCAVQVTSEVVAGAGERAAVYLQGLGTGGYAALKMGCNAKSSEFLVSVGNTVDGLEIRDTNAGATRLAVSNSSGFVGVNTTAPEAHLDVRGRILASASVPSVPTVSPIEIHAQQTSLAIGETAGIRIDCGADPHYQSPGATDTNIGVQAFVNNTYIRDANLWGINCVVIQNAGSSPNPTTGKTTLGGGTQYGIHLVSAELEVCNAATAGTVASDWFEDYNSTKKIRTNGLELTLHAATAMYGNAALTTFAGSFTNAAKWWQAGIGLSCVKDVGIDFRKLDPSYPDPFQTTMLDGSTLGLAIQPFMRCRSGGDMRLDFFNDADHSIYLNVDTGSTTATEGALLFSDRGGRKWLIGKDSSNHLQIGWNDGANAFSAISAYIDDEGTPTEALLSFYGAAPTAKPTVAGSKGGNAALASLLTALATLGLITDSTT